jgi:hypothetical protein
MNQVLLAISGLTVLASLSTIGAQAQSAATEPLQSGTTVRVTLERPLDVRKNKPGDQVIVKTAAKVKSDGRDILPKGAKIIGHLTTVKARSKEDPNSALGIIFDRALLKDGEIPLHVFIQAVAPGQDSAIPTMSMTPATAAGTSGAMGPATGPQTAGPMADPNRGTPGRIESPESPVSSPADDMTSRGELTPSCRGVLRIEGLALAPQDPNFGSVIVSRNRNIQLDLGTQMMLRVPEP